MACNGVLTPPNKNNLHKIRTPQSSELFTLLSNFFLPTPVLKLFNPILNEDEKHENVNPM